MNGPFEGEEKMHPWEKRFEGITKEKKEMMLRELEDHLALRGNRLLTSQEVEELLTLLPSGFFRLLQNHKIERIKRRLTEFPETVASLEGSVNVITEKCKEYLSREAEDEEVEEFLIYMGRLPVYHPALWFKVYKNIADLNISWAVELEAPDKKERFLPL